MQASRKGNLKTFWLKNPNGAHIALLSCDSMAKNYPSEQSLTPPHSNDLPIFWANEVFPSSSIPARFPRCSHATDGA
jgi:hypothetical protein